MRLALALLAIITLLRVATTALAAGDRPAAMAALTASFLRVTTATLAASYRLAAAMLATSGRLAAMLARTLLACRTMATAVTAHRPAGILIIIRHVDDSAVLYITL